MTGRSDKLERVAGKVQKLAVVEHNIGSPGGLHPDTSAVINFGQRSDPTPHRSSSSARTDKRASCVCISSSSATWLTFSTTVKALAELRNASRSVVRPSTLDTVACDFLELKVVGIHTLAVGEGDDFRCLQASEPLHRRRCVRAGILARVVRALHRLVEQGQGAVRYRLPGGRPGTGEKLKIRESSRKRFLRNNAIKL